jgi:DNA-binding PadR family transcriptional regulator
VAQGVLLILAEESMHGYELIAELENRSEGRWRPSPGSMYPTLGRLESRGLIVGVADDDGKKRYELTDEGRERVARRDPDAPLPWDEEMGGSGGSMRAAVAELVGQAKQIGRFGTEEQQASAIEVLAEAKRKLYAVMADTSTN